MLVEMYCVMVKLVVVLLYDIVNSCVFMLLYWFVKVEMLNWMVLLNKKFFRLIL